VGLLPENPNNINRWKAINEVISSLKN